MLFVTTFAGMGTGAPPICRIKTLRSGLCSREILDQI
jgi:hypothetical protein